ncbi:MAG: serine/threonine-protein kinase [Planctomycetota bacterium]
MAVKPKDKLFGAKLLELGYLSEAELNRAYGELTDAHQTTMGLRELLETSGQLTKEKSRAVERALSGGQQIANYELLEKVGQGGMGAVFRARQISMDRIVALKILPPKLAKDKKFCERFIMEARASGGLNHINIIQGIDVGESQGHYYFAMEYVDGCTVKEVIDDHGRLPEPMALQICRQMADALDHAHQHTLVHRDIKPDNIMLANLPENWQELADQGKLQIVAKLCDLGLARSVSTADDMKGVAVGTPHFIAPEQARGETDVDTRADIYSLGASLYNMLTGKTLFSAKSSRDVMMMHLTDQAPDPNTIEGVNVSENTLRIMEKMLAKDRNDRYESPRLLCEDIQTVIAGRRPVYTKGFNAKSSLALPAKLRKGESTGSVRAIRSSRTTTLSGKHASVRSSTTTDKHKKSGANPKLFLIAGVVVLVLGLGVFLVATHGGGAPPPAKHTAVHDDDVTHPADHSTPVATHTDPATSTPDDQDHPSDSHANETIKQAAERVAAATFDKVMKGLGDDPAKNVADLQAARGDVRARPDLLNKLDDRLGQELDKWHAQLAVEWQKIADGPIAADIKDHKFQSARKQVQNADPKFHEIPKNLSDTAAQIDHDEKQAVQADIDQAGKLADKNEFPPALALLDPDTKTEFSDPARARFTDAHKHIDDLFHHWQLLDTAANIDARETQYSNALNGLTAIIADTSKPNRLYTVRSFLRTAAEQKNNLPILLWLDQDVRDANHAVALLQAAEAFLAKHPNTPIYRTGDDGKEVLAKLAGLKDGRIRFDGVSGDFPLADALGSSQIAHLGGALDKDASPDLVLGAAMIAMAQGEYDRARLLLAPLPGYVSAEAFLRLAVLTKQPDDQAAIRRQLDAATLLVEASSLTDAQKIFDAVDTAAGDTPAALVYAARFLEIRNAIAAKGFGASAQAMAAPPPPPPPPPPPAADDGVHGVNVWVFEDVPGLPTWPTGLFKVLKPNYTLVLPNVDFHNHFGGHDIHDNMILHLHTNLNVKPGRYQFRLQCDDGALMRIGEISNRKNRVETQDMTPHTTHATPGVGIDVTGDNPRIFLSIDYFNLHGDGELRVEWIPPGAKDWATLPSDFCFQK